MFSPTFLSSNKLKQIRKLKQKKYRNSTNSFLCEGVRLYDTAIKTRDLEIRDLIVTEDFQKTERGIRICESAKNRGIAVYITDNSVMKDLSEDLTPPGIIFIVEKKSNPQQSLFEHTDKYILYLDKISEPGNLGTILRSACWFGVNTIVLSPESVDPWNAKSVRASAGAIFEVTIYTNIEFRELSEKFKQKDYQIIATVVSNGITPENWKSSSKNIICLGQEAYGLSKEIIKHADLLISIPGYGNIESLNLSVATGIFLYEVTKSDHKGGNL